MADIRRFFASEGLTGAPDKKPTSGSSSSSSSSKAAPAAAKGPRKTAAPAAAQGTAKTPAAGGQPLKRGRGGGPRARTQAPRKKRAASSSSSSSSSSSGGEESEAARSSSSNSSSSSSSSSSEDENFSPPKADAPRKGRLRRAIVSDSEDECTAVNSPASAAASSSSSSKSRSKTSRKTSSSSSSKAEGTRCVILEPGESDSDDGPTDERDKNKKNKKPAVTLEKFLKPAAAAAARDSQQQQKQQQQQQQKQRQEVDVDAFFAAAATKELEKRKRAAAAALIPPAAAAAAKKAKETPQEAAAEDADAEADAMPVDAEKSEPKTGTPSPQTKKRKLPFTTDKKATAAAAAAAATAATAAAAGEKAVKKVKSKASSSAADSTSSSSSSSKLAGKKVVLTGVLQQMTREDAVERILAAGGSVTTAVSGRTDMLVIGSLLEDGRPVESGAKHRKARELQQQGGSIQIIDEEAFLLLLGLPVGAAAAPAAVPAPAALSSPAAASPAAAAAAAAAAVPVAAAAAATKASGRLAEGGVSSLWAETYRPQTPEEFVGNAEPFRLLLEWLRDWNDVCIKELQDLVTGGVTVNFFQLEKKTEKKTGESGKFPCLLLDEVDGLSGGDRGGSQAMLKLIDETRIPIICVCNDRMSSKVRTLAGRCLDLRFEKPPAAALIRRMQQIAKAEELAVSPDALARIAEVSGGDVRQCVGQLQLLAAQLRHSEAQQKAGSLCAGKDAQVTLGPFECCKLLLDSRTGRRLKLWEKLDYFFVDYDMLPLLMQENYLAAISHGVQQRTGGGRQQQRSSSSSSGRGPSAELEALTCSANAARALAVADTASTMLRTSQEWSLLPTLGAFYCVDVPAQVHKVDGFIPRVNFPAWFGRNSTQTKNKRLFSELLLQLMKMPTSGSSIGSLKLSGYLDAIYSLAVAPLLEEGNPKESADRLAAYGLRREHLVEHLQCLMLKRQERRYEKVDSKAKAAFTRHCSALQQQVEIHLSKSSMRKAKGAESLKQALEEEAGDSAFEDSASETDTDKEQPKKKGGPPSKRGGRGASSRGTAKGGGPSKAGAPRGPGRGGGPRRGGRGKT